MQEKKLTMKDFFKKIRTVPAISKFMLNHYSPYRGAGIAIETFNLDRYFIRVKMPLTRKNRNIVGTHAEIKQLAENHEPVFRNYTLNIVDDAGTQIAEVEKVLYIRLKKPKASA